MTQRAVYFLADDEADIPDLEAIARGIAQTLSRGADSHRAAGDHETADVLDAAAVRFNPAMVH